MLIAKDVAAMVKRIWFSSPDVKFVNHCNKTLTFTFYAYRMNCQ